MTRWATDEPGRPPRILTEPRTEEPLEEPDAWSNEALGESQGRGGSTCLLCHGSPLISFEAGCEHVTRESIRERLRGEVREPWYSAHMRCQTGEVVTETGWHCANTDRSITKRHPTEQGAIDLVLDTLVDREVERLWHSTWKKTLLQKVTSTLGQSADDHLLHPESTPRPFAVGDVVTLTRSTGGITPIAPESEGGGGTSGLVTREHVLWRAFNRANAVWVLKLRGGSSLALYDRRFEQLYHVGIVPTVAEWGRPA
jgi:hypothetical protein